MNTDAPQSFAVAVASEVIVLTVIVLFGSAIINLGAIVSFMFGDIQ